MYLTLIVEDNEYFRHSLKSLLLARFPSMRVDEAKDGSEALERVAAELPDLIFMDIHMPGINGLELTRLLKSADRMGTIVILTTHDLPEYREAAEATGADYFIVKGTADQEEITGLVRSIMEKPGG